jgi:hypothetical protein
MADSQVVQFAWWSSGRGKVNRSKERASGGLLGSGGSKAETHSKHQVIGCNYLGKIK